MLRVALILATFVGNSPAVLRAVRRTPQLGQHASGHFLAKRLAPAESVILSHHAPVPVEEDRIRQSAVVVHLPHAAPPEQQRHPEAQFVGERPGVLLVYVLVDTEHGEIRTVEGPSETVEQRKLVAAGPAPAGPEVYEHR